MEQTGTVDGVHDGTRPLEGMRVLDLTDHRGEVGPWLLAELGADVIKVEPPTGSPGRLPGPGADGAYDGQSLRFAAYNANKRSIALDLDDPADRRTFLDLVATSDLLYEAGMPATLAAHGVDAMELRTAQPTLVHVIVTPFGVDGPRALDPASELTIAALAGSATLQGVPERAPVKASIPQVWRHTGAEAAVAGLMAHARMRTTGEGQQVDVSAQATMTWTMLNAMEAQPIQGRNIERSGTLAKLAMELQLRREAADGWVIAIPRGGFVADLLPWLLEEGIVEPSWADEDWTTFEHRLLSGEPTSVTFAEVDRAVDELCRRHDRNTLMRRALELGQTIAPINRVDDLLALDQLTARRSWVPVGSFGDAAVVLPAVHVSVDDQRGTPPRRVLHLDQHGAEIRAELAAAPRVARPTPIGVATERQLPLEGLKVADFSWIGVGPISAKALADHGATVVRIESGSRLDGLRVNPPFKDGVVDVDMSQFYGSFNTSKMSIDIDLKHPEGLEIARRMIAWADVVVESWTPGTFARVGFDDDTVRALNPSVIVLHTSLLASGGPLSPLAGYGYHAGAMAGFYEVVGWSDLPPDGPYLAYTDTIAPRFIIPTLLAAIARRERTGQGCHLEVAQLECGLQFLAPEFLDLQLNSKVAGRDGNRDPDVAPQGMYPCAGDDQWCAITVPDDAAWQRLVELMGTPEWASDDRFATVEGRQAHHDLIDEGIAAWTRSRPADGVATAALSVGLPAGPAQRSSDLMADPQYLYRGFHRWFEHPAMGRVPYSGHPYVIAGYDHGPRAPAPTLGQHTFEVLSDLLGLDGDQIGDIAVSGALG